MIERRAAPRHNINRAGTIAFVGGSVNCTIRNISATGAALEVLSAFSIPHEITLLMAEGRLSQHCYVVWRKQTRVGVMFDLLNEPSIDPVSERDQTQKGFRVRAQDASKSFRLHRSRSFSATPIQRRQSVMPISLTTRCAPRRNGLEQSWTLSIRAGNSDHLSQMRR